MSKKDKGVVHDTIILTIITLAAGLVLGGVHHITAEPIQKQQEATQKAAQKQVFPEAKNFKAVEWDASNTDFAKALEEAGIDQTTVSAVSEAQDASGAKIGYVVTAANKEGYGGDVELMVGIGTAEGTKSLYGISFLNLPETAGMGMKADEPTFRDQFKTVTVSGEELVKYTKNGKQSANEVDAISGCTVTTNAVTKAVNGAITAVSFLEEDE
uniref:Ion-translocating oxidoreductase complex subunit G n=1 Tax=Eubacterium cellulosolvens (strain ATCC 43171 / JCM 9499 / 6) TaxID=633697 RepID=I5AVS1_EUBC6